MADCMRGNTQSSKHHKKRRHAKRCDEERTDQMTNTKRCDEERTDQMTNDYLDGKYRNPNGKTENSRERKDRTDGKQKKRLGSLERVDRQKSRERHRSTERQRSADKTDRPGERRQRYKSTERREQRESSKHRQRKEDDQKRHQSRDRAKTRKRNEEPLDVLPKHDKGDPVAKQHLSDKTSMRRHQSRDRAGRRQARDSSEDCDKVTVQKRRDAASGEKHDENDDDQPHREKKKHRRKEKRRDKREMRNEKREKTKEKHDTEVCIFHREDLKEGKSEKIRNPENDIGGPNKKYQSNINPHADIDGFTRRHDEYNLQRKHYDSDCLSEMNLESIHNEKDSSADKEDLLSDVDTSVKHYSKRERKKEKRVKTKKPKKSREHHKKNRRNRLYHSDSELEVVKSKTRRGKVTSTSDTSVDVCKEQPVNIDALYNLLYRDTDVHNESDVIKEAMKRKMYQHDMVQPNSRIKDKNSLRPVLLDQSSVRSKLIKVLFQRVKDLLKETEDLREERKSLCQKIEKLTSEVEELKKKNLKQSVQEEKIKERLDILADEMKITRQGTSFREEVHSILHNIQHKYQSHWKEHETKINQVQTDAEQEIQSLLKNIVGKYVQLNELKNQERSYHQGNAHQQCTNTFHRELLNKQTEDVSPSLRLLQKHDHNDLKPGVCDSLQNRSQLLPLHIQIGDDVSSTEKFEESWKQREMYIPSSKNMLLKIADPVRMSIQADKGNTDVRHQNVIKQYGSFLHQPDGKDSTSPALSMSDVSRSAVDYKLGGERQLTSRKSCSVPIKIPLEYKEKDTVVNPLAYIDHTTSNVTRSSQQERAYTSSSTISQTVPISNPGTTSMIQNTKYPSKNGDTNLQLGENRLYMKEHYDGSQKTLEGNEGSGSGSRTTLSVKIDSREFWRNRLLQPKPLERMREEKLETPRNQF